MSEDADALADTARNRGLKLVRSRVRTPGRAGFGKFRLVDSGGKIILGAGKQPSATAADVEAYLRTLERKEWSGSLGLKSIPKTKRKRPTEPPPPAFAVREASASDAESVAALIRLLDHPATSRGVAKRLALTASPTLVATLGDEVIGVCGTDISTHIHRDRPVGRITILVVAKAHRGSGVGRMLMEDAERRLRKGGCELVEITSNRRHARAHPFYTHLGYDQPSLRFVKHLRDQRLTL